MEHNARAQTRRFFPVAAARRALYHAAAAAAMAVVFSVALAGEAKTGLTCEQLFAVVQSAVQFRDQGYSLQQVLAGLKGLDTEGKLSREDMQTLHKAVTAAYLGNASPEEIAVACREARAPGPK
jgi:hypothetical protein